MSRSPYVGVGRRRKTQISACRVARSFRAWMGFQHGLRANNLLGSQLLRRTSLHRLGVQVYDVHHCSPSCETVFNESTTTLDKRCSAQIHRLDDGKEWQAMVTDQRAAKQIRRCCHQRVSFTNYIQSRFLSNQPLSPQSFGLLADQVHQQPGVSGAEH